MHPDVLAPELKLPNLGGSKPSTELATGAGTRPLANRPTTTPAPWNPIATVGESAIVYFAFERDVVAPMKAHRNLGFSIAALAIACSLCVVLEGHVATPMW